MPLESPSYMKMQLHGDGVKTKELRIPTFWDEPNQQWIGAIKTPKTKKLITASGKDSFELQNNFNVVMNDIFLKEDEFSEEVFNMFK